MGLAGAAAAGGVAAAFLDLGEGAGQGGPVRSQAGAACVQHGADLGGMLGDAHRPPPVPVASRPSMKITPYQKWPEKSQCENRAAGPRVTFRREAQTRNHLRRPL